MKKTISTLCAALCAAASLAGTLLLAPPATMTGAATNVVQAPASMTGWASVAVAQDAVPTNLPAVYTLWTYQGTNSTLVPLSAAFAPAATNADAGVVEFRFPSAAVNRGIALVTEAATNTARSAVLIYGTTYGE